MLEGEDGPLAVITHDPILREDPGLVAAAVAVLRTGHRERAPGRGGPGPARRGPRLRARLIAAAEDERRRIVRDLHDGAQQRLIARRALHAAGQGGRPPDRPGGPARAPRRRGDHRAARRRRRAAQLARGIHPAILTEEGLGRQCRPGTSLARPSAGRHPGQWPPAIGRRGDGVLHRRRGADQRDQARGRRVGRRPHRANNGHLESRCATTAPAGPTGRAVPA